MSEVSTWKMEVVLCLARSRICVSVQNKPTGNEEWSKQHTGSTFRPKPPLLVMALSTWCVFYDGVLASGEKPLFLWVVILNVDSWSFHALINLLFLLPDWGKTEVRYHKVIRVHHFRLFEMFTQPTDNFSVSLSFFISTFVHGHPSIEIR